MYDFNNELNWRLLKGSHNFPGPSGGTCILEAARLACGLPYKPVWSATGDHVPDHFSPAVAGLAITLNDLAPSDEKRQELLRFVGRIPYSRGDAARESERLSSLTAFIQMNMVFGIMSENTFAAGFGLLDEMLADQPEHPKTTERLEAAKTIDHLKLRARELGEKILAAKKKFKLEDSHV